MAQKRKKNKKHIFWLLMLILLIAVAVVAYLVWDGYFKDENKKVEDEQQAVEQIEEKKEGSEKEKKERKDEADTKEDDEKKVAQYEGEDPNKSGVISGAVTYAGVSGNKLMIRVNIDQFLGGGQCNLNLVRDGVTIYGEVVGVVSSAATSTCEGFDVPAEGLGNGITEVRIEVSDGDKSGTIMSEVSL